MDVRPINAPRVNVTRAGVAGCRGRKTDGRAGRSGNGIVDVALAADFVRDRVRDEVRANEVQLAEGANFRADDRIVSRMSSAGGRAGRWIDTRRAKTRGQYTHQHKQTRDGAQQRQHVELSIRYRNDGCSTKGRPDRRTDRTQPTPAFRSDQWKNSSATGPASRCPMKRGKDCTLSGAGGVFRSAMTQMNPKRRAGSASLRSKQRGRLGTPRHMDQTVAAVGPGTRCRERSPWR